MALTQRLGHAQKYDVAIHLQGGIRMWTQVHGLTAVKWGRKLDDYSEATVTVAKQEAGAACCGRLGQVHTWGHELTIYRDGQMVFQGPIVNKSEFGNRFVFQARDMIAWLDRRSNVKTYNWTPVDELNPGGDGAWDPGIMVAQAMQDAFGDEFDPNLPYTSGWLNLTPDTIEPGPGNIGTMQALSVGEKTIGELVREQLGHGLDLYTVGRHVYILPEDERNPVPDRLTQADFLGELEVRESGLDAATRASVVGAWPLPTTTDGTEPAPTPLRPPPVGIWPATRAAGDTPFYGLIERVSSSPSAGSVEAAESLARLAVSYGNPPPVSVIVPDGTQLSPDAPIGMDRLYPSRRVYVHLADYSTPVVQEFFINEVEVTVSIVAGGVSEAVQASLASKGSPISGVPA